MRTYWKIWLAVPALFAGIVVTTASPAGPAGAAGIPIAPFNECPAVGASPSCKVLLVLEPSGTVTVYDDSSVGDYDGGDDTLVGIVNDSSSAVGAVTVTGPGSYLSEFDGDGLCTFITCSWPNPTTYEGPSNTFVTDPSLPDSAEVDFTGGLAPNASTYFSLEGTLTSAALTARQGTLKGLVYAALGDSYSAGEGNKPFLSGTDTSSDKCHRSDASYPEILRNDPSVGIDGAAFKFDACSGATRQDVWSGFPANSEGSQLSILTPNTDLVTIGVGGDDVLFSDVLHKCITGPLSPWDTLGTSDRCANLPVSDPTTGKKVSLAQREQNLIDALGQDSGIYCNNDLGDVPCIPSLHRLYETIAALSAPNVHEIALLYPHLFTTTPARNGCTLRGFSAATFQASISRNNINFINAGADALDAKIISEVKLAQAAGVHIDWVDPRADFADDGSGSSPGGHGVCTKQPWIQGLVITDHVGSFHPNPTGQAEFAAEVARRITS